MKTPAIIALLFAAVFTSAPGADATVPVITTSPKKVEENFVLVINCTPPEPGKVGDNLHFQIIVASRTGTFSPDAEGLIEIFDSQGHIFSSNLEYKVSAKTLIYEFDLSPKYLTKSRFSFKCTGVDAKGAKTADVIWASLIDFVKPGLR